MNPTPGKPEACSFDVLLAKGYGSKEATIGSVCWDGSKAADGACSWHKNVEASSPMAADSISIDELMFVWGNDWKDKSKVVLNIRLAATITKPVAEHVGLVATAKCGKQQDKEHRIGPDLRFIGSGETVAARMAAFRSTPLAKPDGKCEITFSGGSWRAQDKVEIQKFCLRGTKVNVGKCKGKGKPPAVGTEVEFINEKKAK